jgi:hypothetical protein
MSRLKYKVKKPKKLNTKKIVYDYNRQGYVVTSATTSIAKVFVDMDEYLDFRVGDYRKLFPNFDENKHKFYDEHEEFVEDNTSYRLLSIDTIDKEVISEIPYGVYKAEYELRHGTILKPFNVSGQDKYIDLGRGVNGLQEDFDLFLKIRNKYETFGKRHKKGVLIYGKPGQGKSVEIMQIFKQAENKKFRVILIPSDFPSMDKLDAYKDLLNGEVTVFVMEELTERLKGNNVEPLLTFLDGEESWNNCYVVATTNYPEELPSNLADRTGRFETIIEYKNPTEKQLIKFMNGLKVPKEVVEKDLDQLKDLSLDYLSYIAFQYYLYKKPLSEIIAKLNHQRKEVSETFKGEPKIGLGARRVPKRPSFFTDNWDLIEDED